MAIYIEAGHNLNDSGAIEGKILERELTIEFKKRLSYFLELGLKDYPKVKVHLDNDAWTLGQTISNFKKTLTGNDITFSIHFNSADNKTATGCEIFISDNAGENSKTLATQLNGTYVTILSIKNRGVKKESESNRGRLGILNMKGVAVLCEPCFMSNKSDLDVYEKNKDWLAEDTAFYLIKMDKYLNPKDYV